MKLLLPLLLLAVVAVAGCTSTGQVPATTQSDAAPSASPSAVIAEPPAPAPAAVKEFSMDSFYELVDGKPFPQFSVKELTVNEGDTVRITITNTKGVHDFSIDEFNVKAETPIGEPVTVEFTADRAGEFVYYCSKPGHRANGHWGTLKVLPA